jgi:hypothetical protein
MKNKMKRIRMKVSFIKTNKTLQFFFIFVKFQSFMSCYSINGGAFLKKRIYERNA